MTEKKQAYHITLRTKLLTEVIKHHHYFFPPDRAADTNYKILSPPVII